mmetsp:Transcript_5126/g.10565  ORF Transcript_5126/g.10565 Transcript_5126/m.10565 type:complete len:290 (+) Transcript_5126:172-1041(+)
MTVKQEDSTPKSAEKVPVSVKRPTKKKPKDKPKRPLSAYNFFFKEEREKILKVVLSDESTDTINDPDSDDFITEDKLKRLRKEGGKVSFEEMGKLIGSRWKNLEPDRLSKYSELAAEDTDRYKKEMEEYNGRVEEKMRNEAHKPPLGAYPDHEGKGIPRGAERGVMPPHYEMPGAAYAQGGMSMHGAPYGYPGMEYGGYPAAPYGYGGGYYGEMGHPGYHPVHPDMQGAPPPDYGRGGGGPPMYHPGYQGSMGYGPPPPPHYQGQMPPEGPPGPYGAGYGPGQGWGPQG